jgi:Ca2+-binding EF-hand superfamily protein
MGNSACCLPGGACQCLACCCKGKGDEAIMKGACARARAGVRGRVCARVCARASVDASRRVVPLSLTRARVAIDWDQSGGVTKDEMMEWIMTERFLGNPSFLGESLKHITERFMALDLDQNGLIDRKELRVFLDGLSEADRRSLIVHARDQDRVLRREVLHRVFGALDAEEKGFVTYKQVNQWLKNERGWRKFGATQAGTEAGLNMQGRKKLIAKMDTNHDRRVSFEEFAAFFSEWTLAELRGISEDQLYLAQLREYNRHPTEANRLALEEMREDRDYAALVRKKAEALG